MPHLGKSVQKDPPHETRAAAVTEDVRKEIERHTLSLSSYLHLHHEQGMPTMDTILRHPTCEHAADCV